MENQSADSTTNDVPNSNEHFGVSEKVDVSVLNEIYDSTTFVDNQSIKKESGIRVTFKLNNNSETTEMHVESAGDSSNANGIRADDTAIGNPATAQTVYTSTLVENSNAPSLPNIPTTILVNPLSPEHAASMGIGSQTQETSVPTQTSGADGMTNFAIDQSVATPEPEQRSGRKGKTKRRGSAWTDDETDFLMEVWARHSDAGGTDEFPHSTPVYRLISKAMIEKGFDKSWEQCKTRIHTLKRAYKITQDEITAGKTGIIYCKHFDKLMILMGDDQVTSPKDLAADLAIKREEKETTAKNIQSGVQPKTPTLPATPKRKIQSSDKAVKRQNSGSSDKSPISPVSLNALNIAPRVDALTSYTPQPNVVSSASVWYPAVSVPVMPTSMSVPQQSTVYLPPAQYQMPPPPPPPYQPSSPYSISQNVVTPQVVVPHRPQLQEINNNNINISVKPEPVDEQLKPAFTNIISPVQNLGKVRTTQTLHTSSNNTHSTKSSLQQKKEELEKLKLDLEMRKLDMQRNKLEMEERQRREDRDHQYRMMQLLLFGLGQQNPGNVVGHVTDQDLGNVPNTITLSRAIENGLLPGGTLRANEKGLSFSEI